jgi:hypothetical protein
VGLNQLHNMTHAKIAVQGEGIGEIEKKVWGGGGRILFWTYLIMTQCLSKYFLLSSNSHTVKDQPHSYMHFPYPLQIDLISAFPSSGQILFFFLITFTLQFYMGGHVFFRGLLDISTARYFYKVFKTILHKPTDNSGTNIFYNKCSYKHYLQLFIIYLIL